MKKFAVFFLAIGLTFSGCATMDYRDLFQFDKRIDAGEEARKGNLIRIANAINAVDLRVAALKAQFEEHKATQIIVPALPVTPAPTGEEKTDEAVSVPENGS